MGFFDKKSRQLRKKLKDLQADLRDAEEEGKFVVQDGIFFAEMADMGENTMMVFSVADLHTSQDESVLETFFDRNGFTVEDIKMDRSRQDIKAIEIIPPNEMLVGTAKLLQGHGYRVIDDSDGERPVDLERHVFPISALARAVSANFASRVRQTVAHSAIKMTKEGNRLMGWMPLVVKALEVRISAEAVEAAKPAFDQMFELHYLKPFEKPTRGGRTPTPAPPAEAASAPIHEPSPAAPMDDQQPILPQRFVPPASETAGRRGTPTPTPKAPRTPTPTSAPDQPTPSAPRAATSGQLIERLTKSEKLARVMAAMYRSLVKANPARCVRNAETLLHNVNRLFDASATCIMARVPGTGQMTIYAQAGHALSWGEGKGGAGFAISQTIIRDCLDRGIAVASQPMDGAGDPTQSMIMFHIEATAAAPIKIEGEVRGILYLDRRERGSHFEKVELDMLRKVSQVFQEFPDLTMGVTI